jgi:hypothetical protein
MVSIKPGTRVRSVSPIVAAGAASALLARVAG